MTTPTTLEALFEQCTPHLHAVEQELHEFNRRQQVFEGVVEIVQANPKVNQPSVFYDLLAGSFAHYCASTVRRLVDVRADVLSLRRALYLLGANYELICRDAWVGWAMQDEAVRFGEDDARHLASEAYDTFAGEGADLLPSTICDLNLRLTRGTQRVKKFTNKYVAHHAKKGRRQLADLKISEIFDAIEEVRKIYKLCALIVHYTTTDGTVSIVDPWRQLFEEPWIQRS